VAGSGRVGRNGTGKTTLLKHMAMHAIDGIPRNCQILHVEQEVVGDDTTVLQCVLDSDVERKQLLEEEAQLAQQVCTDVALILFSKPSPCLCWYSCRILCFLCLLKCMAEMLCAGSAFCSNCSY
jgi:hypothetical protein